MVFTPAFCELPRIHHAAVVARPTRSCAFVCTLHLTVVELPLAVLCQHIKADAAPVEIVRTLLRDNVFDNEVVPSEEDAQQELHTFDIVVKAYVEKGIVDQSELLNQCIVFRRNVFLEHSHRVVPSSYRSTIIVCTAAHIVKVEILARKVRKGAALGVLLSARKLATSTRSAHRPRPDGGGRGNGEAWVYEDEKICANLTDFIL